jgi:hypothetical protein
MSPSHFLLEILHSSRLLLGGLRLTVLGLRFGKLSLKVRHNRLFAGESLSAAFHSFT